MKKINPAEMIKNFFLGRRYFQLTDINDQARYMTMNAIFMLVIPPLLYFGLNMVADDFFRGMTTISIVLLALISLILIRSKIPLNYIPPFPVSAFGIYCLYMVYLGDFSLWAAVAILSYPIIAIFLCRAKIGIIQSVLVLAAAIALLVVPLTPNPQTLDITIRFIVGYTLTLSLTIIYEVVSMKKDNKEARLIAELAQERDVIQTMKDNIQQGIFLMDKDHKILPQYSKHLIPILSYYDSDLEGKSFLDILSGSLDSRQLKIMQGYFSMVFSKSKTEKVLEAANPISEFEYKVDDRTKILSTKFRLIEEKTGSTIIGIIQDVTREREFEKELQAQKAAQEQEMKNMFDVIQIDPLVFQDFIDDTESNFNYVNSVLKDRTMPVKQVVTKFFQNIHAIKSNAVILGLDKFSKDLHVLEEEIKAKSRLENITTEDILGLALSLEKIMQEKDNYTTIVKRIEAFKSSHQLDTILMHSMSMAVEKIAAETQKKIELKAGYIDMRVLETKLRKPIKDILFQCVRNSIYHGIETVDERIKKNKKPQGLLEFSLKNEGGKAELTFSDDGRGLDWDAIKKRYLKMNPDTKAVTRKKLLSLIFTPEFSTSKESNLIAGQGVGLSLVKDLVKENGGTINVNSSETGLTLKFNFPIPA